MSRNSYTTVKSQGGWLMPVAAFIIVVMGLLAVALSRISSQAAVSVPQEQISLQSFYAAESGAQYAMHRLYNPAALVNRTNATNNCAAVNGSSLNYSAASMGSCSADISCQSVTNGADTITFYTIVSVGQCGGGDVRAERTVQVSTFLE